MEAVTGLDNHFQKNKSIVYFEELRLFKNAQLGIQDAPFYGCSSLKSISLPESFNAGNKYNIFRDCTSLTNVDIPDSFVELGGFAFSGCTSLASINLPASLVYLSDSAFRNSGLVSIIIPEGVETVGDSAFYLCLNLETAVIGVSVKSINANAFEGCTNMKTIVLKATTPPTFGYNAMGWNNTSSIYVPDESLEAYKSASGWSANNIKVRLKPMSSKPE